MLIGPCLAYLGWILVNAAPDRPFYSMLAMFALGIVLMSVGAACFVEGVIGV